ncbi:beta-galactosidase-like isoform X2 [Centruroides sculpturatus]|uniref:beta-galactosidase-like isoform X2 n=1 Tax=Centruroides sculpturatus TaxID=218467 RepID=UPI000C6E09B0|nr:beta-galactosidase-like isoform X2 [Centruroides sculpturatus]
MSRAAIILKNKFITAKKLRKLYSMKLLFFLISSCIFPSIYSIRSFSVDFENNCFLKDGQPFRYISGSLHYFRVPKVYWRDRMIKMKAAGLNALQTYVEWSSHEPEIGTYNFRDNNDIFTFLDTAQEVGLLVIFRPGPYICAERDLGGFPYWLLREKPNIVLRSSDNTYLKYVDKWLGVLLPLIKPYLYENGGPIITVQVENEYGQHGCDFEYMSHLRDVIRHYLGNNIVLFKTDIPKDVFYKCDNIDGVLTTADFGSGSNVSEAFQNIRHFERSGPLVVTEYYPGWMDHWGDAHANVNIDAICKTLDQILKNNASVNFYMFHGGTNFGFTNGANMQYSPQVTSYDYSAPISEAGDLTAKYFKIRNVIKSYIPSPLPDPPPPSKKLALNPLIMKYVAPLLNSIIYLGTSSSIYSKYPKTFEEISQKSGFVSYSTLIKIIPTDPILLNVPGLHDRGYIFIDNKFCGIISRQMNIFSLPLKIMRGQILTILVENQGRINSGDSDFKGLTSNVTLGNEMLINWVIQKIPLNNTKLIHSLDKMYHPKNPEEYVAEMPGFFSVNFTLPTAAEPLDSFLNLRNWTKGVAFLNGFNLGRYWPAMGPQVTLYTPGILFHPFPQQNNLVLLELESAPCNAISSCTVEFINYSILDGPIPQ